MAYGVLIGGFQQYKPGRACECWFQIPADVEFQRSGVRECLMGLALSAVPRCR
jgi:hypothetical protein